MSIYLGAVRISKFEPLLKELKEVTDKKSLYAWKNNLNKFRKTGEVTLRELFDLKDEFRKESKNYNFKYQKFF